MRRRSRPGMPEATAAFSSRAPSMWRRRPRSSANARISASRSSGQIAPPPRLVVFSIEMNAVRAAWVPPLLRSGRT